MKKWIAAMLFLAIILFGSVIGFDQFKQTMIADYLANQPVPQLPVEATGVQSRDWQPRIASIGLIEPRRGVTVSASVSGLVTAIHFKSGDQVKKGQLLVELDRGVEKANLASARSRLPAIQSSYERNQTLYKRNTISKKALDDAQSEFFALKSEIESLKAVIKRREIRAPFTGVVGLREVHLGVYLEAGDQITRLQSLDAMLVRFIIPQKNLSELAIGMAVDISTDAYPEHRFTGQISALDSAVNRDSGVIHVQAEIPNSDQLLRAGMYASVEILQPLIPNALVIPTRSINFSLYGEQVYLLQETPAAEEGVAPQLSVEQRSVTVAERHGEWSLISKGLQAGDRVITSGQVRLSNGAQVKLVDDGVALTTPTVQTETGSDADSNPDTLVQAAAEQ
ncbi:MAG: efflux RND transporter periplasmic adaptor subunit [Motiliproteus sp.]